MAARLMLAAFAIAFGVAGWTTGGFERIIPDFLRLVDGPLPVISDLFRWRLEWGTLAAFASLNLLVFFTHTTSRKMLLERLPIVSMAAVGLSMAMVTAQIALIWLMRTFEPMASHRAAWITLMILPAAIPCGILIVIMTGMWWLAPMFQSLRDGSLPTLPPFPLRSLARTVTVFVAQSIFRAYWIGSYGILTLFVLDGCVLAVRVGILKACEVTSTSSAS